MKAESSLKAQNIKWLVMLAALDVLIVLVFVFPEVIENGEIKRLAVVRGLITSVLPVVVLLLAGMLSHDIKAQLVFWRIKNPLPGAEAFTRYAPTDVRIDMAALKKNVGELPTDPSEQNKKWFKLYRMVEKDGAVTEAHKMYLLCRDMAAMSIPLIVLVPVGLHFVGVTSLALCVTAGMFVIQYFVARVNARNSGIRFVCNVLAIHSTKKMANAKAVVA
ncbi:hypothetical protein [Variovorax sp. LG9.2]|uniref:hypothetical protein n=1 Tax=Variovorax sp. LG9.2 TaxID=3048626 RepID=UPI002B227103|nr:hypothetical protein [Variovorax sp. LG9.2]MEB0060344.1 hypothetical protein [Variovorax sp. LG9.2]